MIAFLYISTISEGSSLADIAPESDFTVCIVDISH